MTKSQRWKLGFIIGTKDTHTHICYYISSQLLSGQESKLGKRERKREFHPGTFGLLDDTF